VPKTFLCFREIGEEVKRKAINKQTQKNMTISCFDLIDDILFLLPAAHMLRKGVDASVA
jgi:hypothetical protein